MSARIQRLPDFIANQIAAGEVVERPVSVVKELLENAIDAGASQIDVFLEFGGLNRIAVRDNGQGIHPDDLELAVSAHATSKIRSTDDLLAIQTLGFRGEALASIASVSKFSIRSKTKDMPQALCLRVENAVSEISPCAHNTGTTVDAAELFFNAPVRKKFLKSPKTEFHAIELLIRRYAMARLDIAFSLYHNGKKLWDLPRALDVSNTQKRLQKTMGTSFIKAACPFDIERAGIHLHGWYTKPEYQRNQSDGICVFVNQRLVKDKLLLHSIKKAYASHLLPGKYPSALLYLELDPAKVDVNVHPTKYEVRFLESRLVHDFILQSLMQALAHTANPEPERASATQSSGFEQQDSRVTVSNTVRQRVFIAKQYTLEQDDEGVYLLDARQARRFALHHALQQWGFPWKTRPLLLPYRLHLFDVLDWARLRSWDWMRFGFELVLEPPTIHVLAIPAGLPQLPLESFFCKLASVPVLNEQTFIAEAVDAELSSSISESDLEPMLKAYLSHAKSALKAGTSCPGMVSLTEHFCQKILYET